MLAVFSHPACLEHDTGPGHVESPRRLSAIQEALKQACPEQIWREAPLASRGQLQRVHTERLLAMVLETAPAARMPLDPDTVLSPGSAQAALRAAGAGVAAVDTVMAGGTTRAFCAIRPPGHHATCDTAMGFCLFNNIAIAARHALEAHGLTRVAIADFDVHHGNGTQAIFEDDPRVLYASSHQWPLYPGSGGRDEVGCGNIHNLPLPAGSGSDSFRHAWRDHLLPAIAAFKPQLVLISAGFDGHVDDPLATLRLTSDDFDWLTRALVTLADRHAAGRVVSMLEGGYDVAALAACCVAHIGALRA